MILCLANSIPTYAELRITTASLYGYSNLQQDIPAGTTVYLSPWRNIPTNKCKRQRKHTQSFKQWRSIINQEEVRRIRVSSTSIEPVFNLSMQSIYSVPCFNVNTVSLGIDIPIVKIGRSWVCFIFMMGIPILVIIFTKVLHLTLICVDHA